MTITIYPWTIFAGASLRDCMIAPIELVLSADIENGLCRCEIDYWVALISVIEDVIKEQDEAASD